MKCRREKAAETIACQIVESKLVPRENQVRQLNQAPLPFFKTKT